MREVIDFIRSSIRPNEQEKIVHTAYAKLHDPNYDEEKVEISGDEKVDISALKIDEDFDQIMLDIGILYIRIIKIDDLVVWEPHIETAEGHQHALASEKGNFSYLDTLPLFHRDLKKLAQVIDAFPFIQPDVMYGDASNQVLYTFLKNLNPDLVRQDIHRPFFTRRGYVATGGLTGLFQSAPGDWRKKLFLMDVTAGLSVIREAQKSRNLYEMLGNRRKKK